MLSTRIIQNDGLRRAVELFHNQVGLARALDVHPMTITQWKRRGNVPILQAIAIERITDKKVMRQDICPELFAEAGPSR